MSLLGGTIECVGISGDPEETFTAYHIMFDQGFGPLAGLYNEHHLLPDQKCWVGVRDGTRNVRILFKRDLKIQ